MKMIPLESSLYKKRTDCRVCKADTVRTVLSLGATPPANAFLTKKDLGKKECSFPLELNVCGRCGFAQLGDIVSPKVLFEDYVYVSSTSPTFIAHFEEFASTVTDRFSFPRDPFIVDIGSNDGILLKPFRDRGWKVLGVEPATKIAKTAMKSGIPTEPVFFSHAAAKKILKKFGTANVITATSVFPHIDDLDDIIAGVKELLADDGVFIIECYYLVDLVQKNLFDTIYHEHLSYFTVKTLDTLFTRLGMKIFDIERVDTHGGSLRVYVEKESGTRPRSASLTERMAHEDTIGIHEMKTFQTFAKAIEENKKNLTELLNSLKRENKHIVGYGAAAKGNTLLNYFAIGPLVLDYIVDDSSWKQGLFTPGTHIPVVSSHELEKKRPDYILILAWNFAEPIMKKYATLKKLGTKFIIPVPTPKII